MALLHADRVSSDYSQEGGIAHSRLHQQHCSMESLQFVTAETGVQDNILPVLYGSDDQRSKVVPFLDMT